MTCEHCRPKWTTARDVLQAELATHQRLANEARNDEARAIWRAALAEARIAIIRERLALIEAASAAGYEPAPHVVAEGIDNRWRGLSYDPDTAQRYE